MAPKKISKKAKATAKAAAGVVEAQIPAPVTVDVISPHLAKIHQALATISSHDLFKDIVNEKPLGVKAGGYQAPFDQSDCTSSLKRGEGSAYISGCNFFWQDHVWMANHRMPINDSQVQQIVRAQLKIDEPPARFPFTITIALDSPNMQVGDHLGALKRVSPPEPAHALLFAIAAAITGQQPDGVLQRWKSLLLTTEFEFIVVEDGGDNRYWKYQELRQRAIEIGDNAKITTRQWIYDIMGFKMDKQKACGREMGAHNIHQAYKESVKFWARTTEEISVGFVDSAITVYTRIFSIPAASAAIQWCDENLSSTQNPFTSIWTLQAIIDRAKTPEKIEWGCQGLVDHLRMGIIDKSVFANAKLRCHRRPPTHLPTHPRPPTRTHPPTQCQPLAYPSRTIHPSNYFLCSSCCTSINQSCRVTVNIR